MDGTRTKTQGSYSVPCDIHTLIAHNVWLKCHLLFLKSSVILLGAELIVCFSVIKQLNISYALSTFYQHKFIIIKISQVHVVWAGLKCENFTFSNIKVKGDFGKGAYFLLFIYLPSF